ncbi:MAG: RluA family pseudouridine synthase [Alphaproteobacteria bacterium]|nr:RluA family pseudouridine synthase [Alphaproteobacteria bacterium]
MTRVETRTIGPEDGEIRLDRWFRRHFPQLTHGRLQKLLRTGQVRVDGRRAEANLRLKPGQTVRVPPLGAPEAAPAPAPARRPVSARDAEMLERAVLHRDDWLIALDKPAGLAVQGGTGTQRHLDAMLDALRFGAAERPRLVHRLDRDTSGVLLLGRTASAAAALAEAFRQKTTRKTYWAIVLGRPRLAQGRIDAALAKRLGRQGERVMTADQTDEDARHAVTLYDTLDSAGGRATWLALWPVTGRTHQLRAHCALIGTPILGDAKYGVGKPLGPALPRRLHLHARSIVLPHPKGGMLHVTAPLPADLRATWEFLGFDPDRDDDPFAGVEP